MKHIKTYEELNLGNPQIGDWVYCQIEKPADREALEILEGDINFLNDHVGELVEMKEQWWSEEFDYIVEYEDKILDFNRNQIKYWSKNKEEVEAFIAAKKYNL